MKRKISTETIRGDYLVFNDLKCTVDVNYEHYPEKRVRFFYLDSEIVDGIHSMFIDTTFSIQYVEEEGFLRATNPNPNNKFVQFMWTLNALQNTWMVSCPYYKLEAIFRSIIDAEFCDEVCLKGFEYEGGNTTKLTGDHIDRLCICMGQVGSTHVLKAADLMNAPYTGHLNTADTAIENKYYHRNMLAYDKLIELGMMCHTSTGGKFYLQLPCIKFAEEYIVQTFNTLRRRFRKPETYDADGATHGETLCKEQFAAVKTSMTNPVSYISGSAGRGKSSAIMNIIRRSESTIICTPTHAARKVVKKRVDKTNLQSKCRVEVISFINCHAHKYRFGKRFSSTHMYPREEELFDICVDSELETLVVEEASMVDTLSLCRVLESMIMGFPTLRRVVLVGDPNQLRSISKGNILHDIILSDSIPGTTLQINHRSGTLSQNIDCILEGSFDEIVTAPKKFDVKIVKEVDTVVEKTKTRHYAAHKVMQEYRSHVDEGFQVHVVSYMNEEVRRINKAIKGNYFPKMSSSFQKGCKVRVKDPKLISGCVVHKNDIIEIISRQSSECGEMFELRVKEWSRTRNSKPEIPFNMYIAKKCMNHALELGYSTTCHSFQGDEADVIIIHAVQNCKFFDRLALYTAASRARDRIVLVTTDDSSNDWESIVETLNSERISCFSQILREKMNKF